MLLVRTLARYSADVREQPGTPSAIETAAPGLLDWLEAAVELYDDYLLNGLHWVKSSYLSTSPSNNPINWGRTLARSPAFVEEEVPLFLEPYRRFRSRSTDDLLHRLHASLLDEIGELLIGRTIVEGGQALQASELNQIRSSPDGVLSEIERNLFADRPKRLVRLIRRYLQASSEGAGERECSSVLCRAENFELIWEHMLRAAMENASGSKAKILPTGRWRSAAGVEKPGIRPRLDFAYRGNDDKGSYLVIFDAKDRAASSERAGSQQDHYKQIIYALLIGSNRLYNILVFPTIAGVGSYPLKLSGSHDWELLPASRVFEVAADYVQVCEAFIHRWTIDPRPLVTEVVPLAA
jgi:hypothetical protein